MMRYLQRVSTALQNKSIGSDKVRLDYKTKFDDLQKGFTEWKSRYEALIQKRLAQAETEVNTLADDRDFYVEFGQQTLEFLEKHADFFQAYFSELDKAVTKIEKAAERKIPGQIVI